MARLSKQTRTILIAVGIMAALGIIMAVLLLTKPAEDTTSDVTSGTSTPAETYTLTDKQGTQVTQLDISNESGDYTFIRDKRVVSTTDAEGNVTSTDEYFWTSEQMMGLAPNDATIKALMNSLAKLTAKDMVEQAAADLAKYGLETPLATARLTFEDGTQTTLNFGIANPAATNYVYCTKDDSSDVYQASNYSVGSVFNAVTDFVNLTFTATYNTSDPQELDYFRIERKDLEEPIEISYMYDIQEKAAEEDSVIMTFNTHRMTKPFIAEVDVTKGQTICYGLYGLTASYCVSATATEQQLADAGLDDPFMTMTFKYGNTRYVMHFGDQIITTTETDNADAPTLTTVEGYYAQCEGIDAIFAFDVDSVPWYTVPLEEIISRRPFSPYIYTCDNVIITTPDRVYDFAITGEGAESSFTLDGEAVNRDKFKQVYQHLISPVGDEIFREDGDYEPYISVTFNYRKEYHDVYGTASDTIEFFKSDDRKNIVSVNGNVLFKVRQVYTERLLENIDALLNGGEIRLDW